MCHCSRIHRLGIKRKATGEAGMCSLNIVILQFSRPPDLSRARARPWMRLRVHLWGGSFLERVYLQPGCHPAPFYGPLCGAWKSVATVDTSGKGYGVTAVCQILPARKGPFNLCIGSFISSFAVTLGALPKVTGLFVGEI